jgi:hypothetical protein
MIRTCNLLIRSQMLYPIELRVRLEGGKGSAEGENVKVGRGAQDTGDGIQETGDV